MKTNEPEKIVIKEPEIVYIEKPSNKNEKEHLEQISKYKGQTKQYKEIIDKLSKQILKLEATSIDMTPSSVLNSAFNTGGLADLKNECT